MASEIGLSTRRTERVMTELWNEVLRAPGVLSANDNFFELGGDSIGMVTVLFRIQEEFSIELPAEALFSAATLRELAAVVDEVSSESQSGVAQLSIEEG